MRWTALALVLATIVLWACGAKPTSATHSPSVSAASASSVSAATLNCRLPVAGYVQGAGPDDIVGVDGQPSQKGAGGFLDLPSGKFSPTSDSDRSYVASVGVWLPVSPKAISPDQGSYVEGRVPLVNLSTPPGTTTLYLVQVRTKAERLLFRAPEGQVAVVHAFTSKGIYIEIDSLNGPGPMALLLIDPATGASQWVPWTQAQVQAIRQFMKIAGNFAWGMLSTGSGSSRKLVRLSLTDGSVVDWYHPPGPTYLVGFDPDGHPIIGRLGTDVAGSSRIALFLIPAPNQVIAIQPHGGIFHGGRGDSISDAHGTWFGSPDGSIWLYSSTAGLNKVASVAHQPGGTGLESDRSIAGPCV